MRTDGIVPKDISFLILEDTVLFQRKILVELKKMGFSGHTIVTPSVKEAISLAINEEIDFIVVDYYLPDGTGVEFIEAVRGMDGHKKTPILMVTTADGVSNMIDAINSGASNYMVKPWEPAEFPEKIHYCWKKSKE
ncbi:MAG: response regulator [Bacteriovoracaceae bacterium]|jgi:two-component system, chemotaxis family, chemotaxis protein CheY|nr:response regulator [Bacteriovoracaceae bacterium]